MKRILCRLLIVLMAWTPFQIAQAGMIGTDQVVQSSAQAERNTVLQFLNRDDVQRQLQSFGLDPATAKDRVAAMTDDEARYLAGRVGTAPAGAMSDAAAVLLVIVIIAVIWWAWKR